MYPLRNTSLLSNETVPASRSWKDDRALFELPPLEGADRAERHAGVSESTSHEHA